jgi:ElaB/YqjD/DUF883 family membrane-anchored ribosome-binding protein
MNNADEIVSDIERIQGEMAETIHALKSKLSINHIVEEAIDVMRSIDITQSAAAQLVRDNPLPTVLVGLGFGWLALSALRAGGTSSAIPRPDDAADSLSELTESARKAARRAGERVQVQARQAGERVRVAAGKVQSSVSGMTDDAGDLFHRYPLAIGLCAVAAGFALGAALPDRTPKAVSLGQRVAHSVRGAGHYMAHRAGDALHRVADATAAVAGDGREHPLPH